MKEKPILFSGPMVRAILDGRKTMTRRVVNWSNVADAHACTPVVEHSPFMGVNRLWVRETWNTSEQWVNLKPSELPISTEEVFYAADFSPSNRAICKPWRSPLFMTRALSRITLEVTGVRVERLQAISIVDAINEGAFCIPDEMKQDAGRQAAYEGRKSCSAVDYFRQLWNSLNAKRGFGWDVNPWVWVVEFRRVNQ